MIRNEEIIYSNNALKKLFNIDALTNFTSPLSKDPSSSDQQKIHKHFENCKIKRYFRNEKNNEKRQVQREITVLEFIQSNKPGGVFEI